MRWNEITASGVKYWECVFVNVPFKVRYYPDERMDLFFCKGNKEYLLHCGSSKSIETAKLEVESFVLDHLALYSAQVHRECLEANVMTWRKLKEQLEQIPEDQLDDAIKVLDSSDDWHGYPEIVKADKDQFKDDDCRNVTDFNTIVDDQVLVVENGAYYLSIEL